MNSLWQRKRSYVLIPIVFSIVLLGLSFSLGVQSGIAISNDKKLVAYAMNFLTPSFMAMIGTLIVSVTVFLHLHIECKCPINTKTEGEDASDKRNGED